MASPSSSFSLLMASLYGMSLYRQVPPIGLGVPDVFGFVKSMFEVRFWLI